MGYLMYFVNEFASPLAIGAVLLATVFITAYILDRNDYETHRKN